MRFVPFSSTADAWSRRMDDLRFGFRKWDLHVNGRSTVAPGALVLTRQEHREVVRIAEGLDAAATHVRRTLPDSEEATRVLGVPPAIRGLLGDGDARGRVCRMDFFKTPEGWRVSEFNDDVPGGYNDALGLAALFTDLVAEEGLAPPGDLPNVLPKLLAPDGGPVGLVFATAYAEDLQVVRLLADLLEAEGVETVLASPAHLRFQDGTARLGDVRVRSIYRFFPSEWFPLLDNLDDWRAAIASGVPVVNPFRCAWSQSKLAFALLPELAHGADAELVRRHLPRTIPLEAASRVEALADPARWVLKPAFGRMGEGVVLGALTPPDEWRKRLAAAAHREGPSALQERFHVLPVETGPGESRTPCLGVYLADGRFAGYYSRLSARRVVAYDAANVLTLVESV